MPLPLPRGSLLNLVHPARIPLAFARRIFTTLRATLLIGLLATLLACSPSASDDDPADGTAAEPSGVANQTVSSEAASSMSAGESSTGSFALKASLPSIELTEGEAASKVRITLTPLITDVDEVDLQIETDSDDLQVALSSLAVDGSAATALLSVEQPIGIAPILPGVARVAITATDDTGESASLTLSVNLRPTAKPDVYLLAGQSNMIGFSGTGAQLADEGQPDAVMADVLQLNVTGNDQQNFAAPTAFTDTSRIAVRSPRYVPAVDPLHDGFDPGIGGKSGSQIGPALSFARRAREASTADIVLVPAAWSDTGFCGRSSNRFEGMGWNPEQPDSDVFSGTLLFDRAVARTNLALAETDGVLRGILWHQGEADSDDAACAAAYAGNLVAMAEALRSSIIVDARGDQARGADAAVPFVVGTMSRGADSRGDYSVFSASKQQVDDAHRSVSALITFADFVNNDDLVPPEYPCGEAACVHFGAASYREMGSRYFEALQRIVEP